MVNIRLILLGYFFIMVFFVATFLSCRNQNKLKECTEIDSLSTYPNSTFVLPDTVSIDSLKKLIEADTSINEIRFLLDSMIKKYESEE